MISINVPLKSTFFFSPYYTEHAQTLEEGVKRLTQSTDHLYLISATWPWKLWLNSLDRMPAFNQIFLISVRFLCSSQMERTFFFKVREKEKSPSISKIFKVWWKILNYEPKKWKIQQSSTDNILYMSRIGMWAISMIKKGQDVISILLRFLMQSQMVEKTA